MKYDAILYIEEDRNIFEADARIAGNGKIDAAIKSMTGRGYYNTDDPQMYNEFTFGKIIKRALDAIQGFHAEVSDFKKWVVVRVTYSNYETSRTASKTFLVVFKQDKEGIVLSTHNRYRSISGVDQAISYIKSACSNLISSTSTKI